MTWVPENPFGFVYLHKLNCKINITFLPNPKLTHLKFRIHFHRVSSLYWIYFHQNKKCNFYYMRIDMIHYWVYRMYKWFLYSLMLNITWNKRKNRFFKGLWYKRFLDYFVLIMISIFSHTYLHTWIPCLPPLFYRLIYIGPSCEGDSLWFNSWLVILKPSGVSLFRLSPICPLSLHVRLLPRSTLGRRPMNLRSRSRPETCQGPFPLSLPWLSVLWQLTLQDRYLDRYLHTRYLGGYLHTRPSP